MILSGMVGTAAESPGSNAAGDVLTVTVMAVQAMNSAIATNWQAAAAPT